MSKMSIRYEAMWEFELNAVNLNTLIVCVEIYLALLQTYKRCQKISVLLHTSDKVKFFMKGNETTKINIMAIRKSEREKLIILINCGNFFFKASFLSGFTYLKFKNQHSMMIETIKMKIGFYNSV